MRYCKFTRICSIIIILLLSILSEQACINIKFPGYTDTFHIENRTNFKLYFRWHGCRYGSGNYYDRDIIIEPYQKGELFWTEIWYDGTHEIDYQIDYSFSNTISGDPNNEAYIQVTNSDGKVLIEWSASGSNDYFYHKENWSLNEDYLLKQWISWTFTITPDMLNL